jgi:hypothetical protein
LDFSNFVGTRYHYTFTVDWSAHLGGLISGLCIGFVVFSLKMKNSVWKFFWCLVGVGTTTAYFVVSLQYMYSGRLEVTEDLEDVCAYYKEYFGEYECNCAREN